MNYDYYAGVLRKHIDNLASYFDCYIQNCEIFKIVIKNYFE